MNNTTKTKGRQGKTAGSFSFVLIPVQEICAKLSPNAKVKVSRLWAQAVGFENLVTGKAASLTEKVTAENPETAVKVSVVEL